MRGMTDQIKCVWEHNGSDTLLYAVDFPGAYTRGKSLDTAKTKMLQEIHAYAQWASAKVSEPFEVEIIQDAPCALAVRDADSDVLFETEKLPLTLEEYRQFKALALKSASDFQTLYDSIADQQATDIPQRRTFYGPVPRTAEEMYRHTKHVNAYYFGEIGVETDNGGTIAECRVRGFEMLEKQPDFLENPVFEGSYGESWTLRKVLRRFIWHDRIHGKAMYRMACRMFGTENVANPFCFDPKA